MIDLLVFGLNSCIFLLNAFEFVENSSTFAPRSDRNNDSKTQTSPARGLKRAEESGIYWDNVLEDIKE